MVFLQGDSTGYIFLIREGLYFIWISIFHQPNIYAGKLILSANNDIRL